MSENTWPVTLKEAVRQLQEAVSDQDRSEFGAMEKDDFTIRMHHDLGRWIRNQFGLWQGNHELRKLCAPLITPPENLDDGLPHPDACSGVLMGLFWEQLQN